MDADTEAEAQRWESWRLANNLYSSARERELRRLCETLQPRAGERVWEAGTGNANLTRLLAKALVPGGIVVTTDVEKQNTASAVRIAQQEQLPVRALLLPLERPLLEPGEEDPFDAVASIATLHHFDDRRLGTGEQGRLKALQAFYAMLRPGGRLALADVLDDSLAQRYFDTIDNPQHAAPHGHPHDFVGRSRLLEMLAQVGFRDIVFEFAYVPWIFSSPQQATDFVHKLHNAAVSPEESFAVAERMLGFTKFGEQYELGWDLFFVSAKK